ncbi:MAG: surfeit locus 1 family protein [Saprospiraceae bacterium]|jgi:surfeit locus 1 family protein
MKKAIVIGVYLFGLALLLSLGAWQLQRGQHKAQLEQRYELGLQEPTLISGTQFGGLNNYQRVSVEGQWQNQHSFLLQNRIHQGQVGVEVLTPFQPKEGEPFIINRGWVSATELGSLEFIARSKETTVTGTVYKPSKGVTIGESILDTATWPVDSLYFDMAAFSKQLERPLAEKVLVLQEADTASLKKIWLPVTMSSTKHYGYAVQWFGLAITFIIFGFIWFRSSFKNRG